MNIFSSDVWQAPKLLVNIFSIDKFTAGLIQQPIVPAHQVDITAAATGNRLNRITRFCQVFADVEIGIQQIRMVREQRPQHWQNGFVARNNRPQRFKDHHFRAQQHVNQAHFVIWVTGTNRHGGIFVFVDFTHLLNGGFPRPGFPYAVHQTPVAVNQLTGGIPAQFVEAIENFALKARLLKGTLHKLGVVIFLQIVVLHDVHKRSGLAVFPRAHQLAQQVFRRIMPVAAIAGFQPLFEDQATFGVAGGGVGVVFVNLQPALVHAEVHAPGDHVVATTLPGEAQTRPEDFRNVEQRQQAVVTHHFVGGVEIHQVHLVGRFNQLLLGAFGHGEILVRVSIDHMTVGGNIRLLERIFFVQPFAVELTVVLKTRAAKLQRFTGNGWLRQAVACIVGLDHPAKNGGVVEGVMQRVVTVFHFKRQLAGPLLACWQRRVQHILFGNTHFVPQQLGNHRHVAGFIKLTALLPDKQRADERRAARAVGEGLKRENRVVDHLA